MTRHRVAIVACARWETPYVAEWLDYHRAIGVDHVYLYCNDDDPSELYAAAAPWVECDPPFVTFRFFPFLGQQFFIYMHWLTHDRGSAEWVLFLDVDEFLNIRDGNHVGRFLDRLDPGIDSVYFNWLFFGNSGHATPPPGSVLLRYVRREAAIHPTMKTMTRTACIDPARIDRRTYIWHHWDFGVLGPDATCVNVLGDAIATVRGDDEGRSYTARPDIQLRLLATAVVHHYAFKSEQDFARRQRRGLAGDFAGQAMWQGVAAEQAAAALAPMNAVMDTSLAAFWRRRLQPAFAGCIGGAPAGDNIARGRPARQSSVSEWSVAPDIAGDAAGAVNGRITGGFQFHTAYEDGAWWRVDLGGRRDVSAIRIFNRLDSPAMADRLGAFVVETSDDGERWQDLYRHAGGRVGGADGNPLTIRLDWPLACRHIRIRLLAAGFLHLDQVEVYGP